MYPTMAEKPAAQDQQSTQAPTTAQGPAAPGVVPESYDFQMPEGIELDKAAADEFSGIARELKLDQAGAQKVADVAAKMAQRQHDAYAAQVEGWGEAVRADSEIGGANLEQQLPFARDVVDRFGTPELKTLLGPTHKGGWGLGNHPEVVRVFCRIGKALAGR